MKITKSNLQKIIQEELLNVLSENEEFFKDNEDNEVKHMLAGSDVEKISDLFDDLDLDGALLQGALADSMVDAKTLKQLEFIENGIKNLKTATEKAIKLKKEELKRKYSEKTFDPNREDDARKPASAPIVDTNPDAVSP